jgi:uncharacterized protein YyaL (SSP411 family)
VRSAYEPGEVLAGADVNVQLHSALAFLTAFELTGRLPYSMLAEELLQIARRQWWDHDAGGFGTDFRANATGAQLLCRLAALHRDADYAASAVVAPDAKYAFDAEHILSALIDRSRPPRRCRGIRHGASRLVRVARPSELESTPDESARNDRG